MATTKLIVYRSDMPVSFATGNQVCTSQPYIRLVYDEQGASGPYGDIMRVIPPNANMLYVQVILKYNANVNTTTGGLLKLGGIQLIPGDKIWLSGQTDPTNNGIWTVTSTAWIFYTAVTNDVFVDLGARAYDSAQGDLTRQIITNVVVDFGTPGAYEITYYVMNCGGSIISLSRRVEVMLAGASLSPVNNFAVTDYQILPYFDPNLGPNPPVDTCPNQCDQPLGPTTASGSAIASGNCECDLYIRQDGTLPFVANQSMGNNIIQDLANGQVDSDAVNLGQLQTAIENVSKINSYQFNAGVYIPQFTVVYINTDGKVHPANCTDQNEIYRVVGIANLASTISDTISVVTSGILDGLVGLQTGSFYFFDNNGALTVTPPSIGFTQVVGIALSPTRLLVQIQMPLIL